MNEIYLAITNDPSQYSEHEYFIFEYDDSFAVVSRSILGGNNSAYVNTLLKTAEDIYNKEELYSNAPKDKYYEEIIYSEDRNYTIKEIADDYGIEEWKLDYILLKSRVISDDLSSILNRGVGRKYSHLNIGGYNRDTEEYEFNKAGRILIHTILNEKEIKANIDKESKGE